MLGIYDMYNVFIYNKYKSYYVTIHSKLVRCTFFLVRMIILVGSFKSFSDDVDHFENTIHESISYFIVHTRQRGR